MIESNLAKRLEAREQALSSFASKSVDSRGRSTPEQPQPLYTAFQLDRERIIHTNAFRRLKHKTQVFIAPQGDHYVTRLTHTLEVVEVARTIARALNLNEDLCEAIALGHDLGHTPFGHVGEDELNRLYTQGFRHNQQSLRVVELLEHNGRGLNLTWEVKQGIVAHSKPRGDFMAVDDREGLTLEAQVCRISDALAYINHDIEDAIRSGIIREEELPKDATRILGKGRERLTNMISDVVFSSWECTGEMAEGKARIPAITMSSKVRDAVILLRESLFDRVYLPASNSLESQKAREIVRLLYQHLSQNPQGVPSEYSIRGEPVERQAVDYLSGMTDGFALRFAERVRPGISEGIFKEKL